MRRSLADDLRLHRVGYDQARVGRHEMKREVGVYSEIERIAEIPVLRPLAVGHEIPHARLHLDAGEAAIRTKREDIRTAAVRQRNLVQRGPGELTTEPGSGAPDRERSFYAGELHRSLIPLARYGGKHAVSA